MGKKDKRRKMCLFEIERELTFLFQFSPLTHPFTHGRLHLNGRKEDVKKNVQRIKEIQTKEK